MEIVVDARAKREDSSSLMRDTVRIGPYEESTLRKTSLQFLSMRASHTIMDEYHPELHQVTAWVAID